MTPPISNGIAGLAERYDGFILDMWGVLHDGVRALPGVPEALRELKTAGKTLIVLSNAPRRADKVFERAASVGVPTNLLDGVMSSGEDCWRALYGRAGPDAEPFHARLGRRVWLMGAKKDHDVIAGLDVEVAETIESADFVLNVGPAPLRESLADYAGELDAARAADLPMLCCNPDRVVMVGDRAAMCAGALAERYESMGGAVYWHGKPYPGVYARTLALMADIPKARVLAVGDSLLTDVAGAAAAGVDCAFAAGGIHGKDLGVDVGEAPSAAAVDALLADAPVIPTYVIGGLQWV
ncbi:MAG: TIGR01459 family HAD-type hydrolase [Pseudomonadota bacterium]